MFVFLLIFIFGTCFLVNACEQENGRAMNLIVAVDESSALEKQSFEKSEENLRVSSSKFIEKGDKSKSIVKFLGSDVDIGGANKTKKVIKSCCVSVYYEPFKRRYYYGIENFESNKSEDESLICRYYIVPNDELFNLWYENGNRISYIVYECDYSSEECCNGFNCCNKGLEVWEVVLMFVGCFVGLSLICFIIWMIFRKKTPQCRSEALSISSSKSLKKAMAVNSAPSVVLAMDSNENTEDNLPVSVEIHEVTMSSSISEKLKKNKKLLGMRSNKRSLSLL